MNITKLLQIIKEEVQQWFDDEPSIADRIYQNRGIVTSPSRPVQQANDVSGELFGYLTKIWSGGRYEKPISIYKNPRNLRGYDPIVRGVLVDNGDVYIAQYGDAMHYDIIHLLAKEGIIPVSSVVPNYTQAMPEEYITIIRMGSNRFTQSDGYYDFPIYYEEMFEEANRTQPFQFVVSS